MLTASLKGTATTVFLLGLLALGLGVTILARADEHDDGPGIIEAEALFRDGDVVHSVRVLTHGISQQEADAALRSFLRARRYNLSAAQFIRDGDHYGSGRNQEADGGVSAAFTNLFAVWPADEIPVPVHFNPSGGDGQPNLEPAIQHAITQWNGVQGSSFAFSYAGTSTADTCVGQGPNSDGNNVVRYAELANANVLGVTCSSYLTVGFSAGEYLEFDMELNTSVSWDDAQPTDPNSYDIWTTTLHEFGHALGLNHTQSSNCGGGSPAVMCASLGTGVSVRTLKQDDIDAVLSQYGPAPTPTATNPPTATPTPTAPVPTLPSVPTVPNAVPTSTATPTATTTGTPPAIETPSATPSATATGTVTETPTPPARGHFRTFVPFVAGGSGSAAPTDLPPVPAATAVPTAAPTPAGVSGSGEVVITTVRYNPPEPNDASGEFVELRNTGDGPIQLEGWSIHDEEGEFYTFRPFVLAPGATVRVHNCTGNDSASNLYTGNCKAVWNNSGDTAYLYDADGGLVADYSYL